MIDSKTTISLLHIQKSSVQTRKISSFFTENECECPFDIEFNYHRVPNHRIAISFMKKNHVDVILLKVRETSYSQLENIQSLRNALPEKPIILLCDAVRDTSARKALQFGADDCLHSRGLDRELLLRSILLWHRIRLNKKDEEKLCFMDKVCEIFKAMTNEESDDIFLREIAEKLLAIQGLSFASIFGFTDNYNRIYKLSGTAGTCDSSTCSSIPVYGTPFWEEFQNKLRSENLFELQKIDIRAQLEEIEHELFFPHGTSRNFVIPISGNNELLGFILLGVLKAETLTQSEQEFVNVSRNLVSLTLQKRESESMFVELTDTLRLLNKILRHDLMNNLSVLYGVLKLYNTSKDEKLILDSQEAIDRAISFIERMKDYESSLTLGTSLKPMDIRPVIEKVIGNFPVTVGINGNCRANADEAITSVFNNIIGNAVEHSTCDRIDITLTEKSTDAIIEISDNGQGIPDRYKKLIFEEGFSKGINPGTGLGLFIVKKIVTRYHGSITVLDNNPQGTTFRIHLPVPTK